LQLKKHDTLKVRQTDQPAVVGKGGDKNKGLFPPKPSRGDVMVPMFGTQSVAFWYSTSFPQFRTIVRHPTSPPPNLVL